MCTAKSIALGLCVCVQLSSSHCMYVCVCCEVHLDVLGEFHLWCCGSGMSLSSCRNMKVRSSILRLRDRSLITFSPQLY
ncbi:hypothetical protein BDD12DRAFT_862491, partial [Trichophaea hybrida]